MQTATKPKPPRKRNAKDYQKPRSGDLIDQRFQILGRPLGKGGMGTVYRVQDANGAHYALKRLDPALREEKRFEKRFRLEYEAAADLKHPNITGYLELFEAHGALHILMELVEGINLRQLMKEQKQLPMEHAVGVARALARALEHLHAHRVVHRDLKPENVLIGMNGAIKLTDFGISRVEYAGITRTGTLLGTPRYMSPEQLAGKKGEDIGPESDIYSLGILLYELLTGKDPYRLRKKAEILEVINVRHHHNPKSLPKGSDPELERLIMMMLARDASERPSDARWIGQELGRWAAGRKALRVNLRQWVEQSRGGHLSNRPLLSPKRKEDALFRKRHTAGGIVDGDDADTALEPIAFEEPSHGHELLPALLLTLSFLLILWGFGLWANQPKTPAHPASATTSRAGLTPQNSHPRPRQAVPPAKGKVLTYSGKPTKKRKRRNVHKRRSARKRRKTRRVRKKRKQRRTARHRRRLRRRRKRWQRRRRSRRRFRRYRRKRRSAH